MVHQWRKCHSSLSSFERELTLFGRMLRTWLSRHNIFRVGEDIFNETRGGLWLVCPLKEREVMMVAGRARDGERMAEEPVEEGDAGMS